LSVRAPQSNIEIIWADWLDAIRCGDLERLSARITPATTHRGVRPELYCADGDQVIENVRRTMEHLPLVEAIELTACGDHVVLCVRAPEVGAPAGEEFLGQAFIVFTLRDGAITEIRDFLSRGDAMAAAGGLVPAWR
jgi:ketosteroid isomerase-like protein